MAEKQSLDAAGHDQGAKTGTLKRRGLIAGAAALVAGIVAKQTAQPVAASSVMIIADTAGFPTLNIVADQSNLAGSLPAGRAILNANANASAENVIGLIGQGGGPYGTGVMGLMKGTAYPGAANAAGVYGGGSTGVTGLGSIFGVYASGGTYGVLGSSGAYGIYGVTRGTGLVAGVIGTSSSAYGVIGTTAAAGYSGLTGTTNTPGVAALAATALVDGAYAAYFQGYTVVEGNFAVTGNKNTAALHPDGTRRLLYCVEAPEAWFEDVGEAKLVNGHAEVTLDPEFAALIHTEAYHVFLTPGGDCKGLYVTNKRATGFAVGELQAGTSSLLLTWRVMAKRKDIASNRLEKFEVPKIKIVDPDKLPKPEPPRVPSKKP
ncbi:MAG: hypothetical protein ACYDAR_09325 [Thermomicrobiales bacterium]